MLAAWGIDTDGKPVFVALSAVGGGESADAWADFLDRARPTAGCACPLLVISDGAAGLVDAVESDDVRLRCAQRCLIHRCRNVAREGARQHAAGRRSAADYWSIFDLPETHRRRNPARPLPEVTAVGLALYYWRAHRRRSRRTVLAVVLVCGLLGTVALGALAGARRTDTAYGRYLRAINSSDVFVNVPGPVLPAIQQVERLPGVASAAATVGLSANPVVNGKVNDAWLTHGLTGSLDGDGFRQDRMTVLAGRLPRPSATGEIALTPGQARFFHTGVGGHVTYEFYRYNLKTNASVPAGRSTFAVTAIVDVPPALGDQFDQVNQAVLPPAATARYLNGEFAFGWVGLRLTAGSSGIPALQRHLVTVAAGLDRIFRVPPGAIRLNIRPLDIIHHEVQQGIEPQAVALAVLGGLAALALLILAGQAMAQLLDRSTPDLPGLRAMGASRAQAALACGLAGVVAVLSGTAVAVAGAAAVSPFAPVGAVRQFDPARGLQADPLVLAGGGSVLAAALLAVLGVLTWRSARRPGDLPPARAPSVAAAVAAVGLPVSAVVGTREALDRVAGRRPVPVLATLAGSVVAVMAVAMAVVFGASLTGLIADPARYGWNWTLLMDSQGGYGSWSPAQMDRLVSGQPGVIGWSTFAFTQIPIDGQSVPVLGLTRHLGSVEPPTTGGHPIAGPGQIDLGVGTLRQLGKRIGDTVTVGIGRARRIVTIVGTVTLPSIGLTLTDHVSLGRGAMIADSTLLKIQGLSPACQCNRRQARRWLFPPFLRRWRSTWRPASAAGRWWPGSAAPIPAVLQAGPTSCRRTGSGGRRSWTRRGWAASH